MVRDDVFSFIKALKPAGAAEGEEDSIYTQHMKDALFMMPNTRVLANVVDQLDSIDMADRSCAETDILSEPGSCSFLTVHKVTESFG